MSEHANYTNEDVAAIFSRLIITNLIAGDLTPYLAEEWATRAGHYGLKALREREGTCGYEIRTLEQDERAYDEVYAANAQHQQECACDGTSIMHSLVQFTRAAYRVPALKGSK